MPVDPVESPEDPPWRFDPLRNLFKIHLKGGRWFNAIIQVGTMDDKGKSLGKAHLRATWWRLIPNVRRERTRKHQIRALGFVPEGETNVFVDPATTCITCATPGDIWTGGYDDGHHPESDGLLQQEFVNAPGLVSPIGVNEFKDGTIAQVSTKWPRRAEALLWSWDHRDKQWPDDQAKILKDPTELFAPRSLAIAVLLTPGIVSGPFPELKVKFSIYGKGKFIQPGDGDPTFSKEPLGTAVIPFNDKVSRGQLWELKGFLQFPLVATPDEKKSERIFRWTPGIAPSGLSASGDAA